MLETIKKWWNKPYLFNADLHTIPTNVFFQEVNELHKKTKKDFPVRYWIRCSLWNSITSIFYSFKSNIIQLGIKYYLYYIEKPHIIRLDFESSCLSASYQILQVNFELLVRYFENDSRFLKIPRYNIECDNLSRIKQKILIECEDSSKILELYLWWKYVRPTRPSPRAISQSTRDKLGYPSKISDILKLEDEISNSYAEEDQKQLETLISLRHLLW